MKTITISEFRKNLKTYIDLVSDTSDILIVNGSGKTVVMISLEDYNNIDETTYLLSNKYNAKKLKKSIATLIENHK
jgi:antitoxin YefM